MQRQIGHATYMAANAANSAASRPLTSVVPQVPQGTNSMVRASGWIQNGPTYSSDLLPSAAGMPLPGNMGNWTTNNLGNTFASTYPPLPTPFGPDSRSLAPGGAVFPTGDYAGTITDPITGQKYAAFTRAMPDPIIPAGGDMFAEQCPASSQVSNRILESLNGNSALTARPCRQDMPRDWSEALAGTSVPAPLLEQQVLAAQGTQAARDTFFVRKDTPCGYNDTHWDGYIGTTNVLRVLQDTQTVKDYDGGGTSRLPFRPNPDFSLAAPMYHDGTHIGGPRAPVVTILAEDKPAPPGRPTADAVDAYSQGAVRLDTTTDSLRTARLQDVALQSNKTPYLEHLKTAAADMAPVDADGPVKLFSSDTGTLKVGAPTLDSRWAAAAPTFAAIQAADDGRGGRHAAHDALRVSHPTLSGTTTSGLNSDAHVYHDQAKVWMDSSNAAPVRLPHLPGTMNGLSSASATAPAQDGPNGFRDHEAPSFRASLQNSSTFASGSAQPADAAMQGQGRGWVSADAPDARATPVTASGMAATAAPTPTLTSAGRVFSDTTPQFRTNLGANGTGNGININSSAEWTPVMDPAHARADAFTVQPGIVPQSMAQAPNSLQIAPSTESAPRGLATPTFRPTLNQGQFQNTQQQQNLDFAIGMDGRIQFQTHQAPGVRHLDGGGGMNGAVPQPPMATSDKDVRGWDGNIGTVGVRMFSPSSNTAALAPASAPALGSTGRANALSSLPVRVLQSGNGNLFPVPSAPEPVLPDGSQKSYGMHDALRPGVHLNSNTTTSENLQTYIGDSASLKGYESTIATPRISLYSVQDGNNGYTDSGNLEAVLAGGPGRQGGDKVVGAQRATPNLFRSTPTSFAPAPVIGTGPGSWDGAIGAQRTTAFVGYDNDSNGTSVRAPNAQLPGPGQWDGALGAQRPTVFQNVDGDQDMPSQDGGRYATKFMGAGATTNVPRNKTLFWTDGVAAYATIPAVKGKDTGDRTNADADKHSRHLSLLREAMLAAHPATGPDTRVKQLPGPIRQGAVTAQAANCLVGTRQYTDSALLNAALASQQAQAIEAGGAVMPLYDVGYESDY